MPPAQLTEATPAELATGVLAVLAGGDVQTAAAAHRLHPDELTEAVQTYQAAGYAALEHRVEKRWHQVYVEFPDWEQAETIAAARLGPHLDELESRGVVSGWWFLRKRPCWRVRLRSLDRGSPTAIIETLWRTLDLEKGGEIAANLDRLYSFMLNRLTQVDLKNDPAPAREVMTLLEPLRRSWHEIVQREAQAAAAQRPDPTDGAGPDRRMAVTA